VSVEIVRLLLRAGAAENEVEDALGRAVGAGQSLARALVEGDGGLERRLERELQRVEVPSLELVRPELEQLALLPAGLAERLAAVPVRKDARSGRVDVAALDPLDGHVAAELEFHLGAKVRVLRAEPEALKGALAGAVPARTPSGPPLPLVRKAVTADLRGPSLAAKPPESAAPSEPPPPSEPVLSLSRPKMPPTGPQPAVATSPSPSPSPSPAPAPPPAVPLELARSTFEKSRTPDEVVEGLIFGLAPARTAVLAVRSSSYVGRAGSAGFERDAVRKIEILNSSPSVVQTATRAGFYLGALPHTPAHDGLRALFGESDAEIYVASVVASGHPTLVVACDPAGLGGSVDATRRIDALATAAGHALERILVSRKRGS
jgi:hypothetical protein